MLYLQGTVQPLFKSGYAIKGVAFNQVNTILSQKHLHCKKGKAKKVQVTERIT